MWLLLAACVLLLLLYIIFVKQSYWKNKGIPGPRPLPLVGNVGASLLGKKNIFEVYEDIYNQFQDCPFVGIYRTVTPCLLLRDPEVIKNVLIKDFNNFADQDIFVDKKIDPIFGRNPFVLKGEEWKKARQFVTPNFASGKVKAMFPIAEHASKNFIKYLEKHDNSSLNGKDVLLRYSCDVVAICAFGIEGNSFDDSNAKFLNLIKGFNIPGSLQELKLAISFLLPKLINLKLLSKNFDDGLIALTEETLKYRKEHSIKRNDYFDVVTQTPISLIEMAAHLGTFILDGAETTSWVMPLVFYQLAVNSGCQDKLREEINTVLKKCEGEFSYEAVQSMDYLEACINESLRLHPPFGHLSRTCVQDCTITSSGSQFRNLSVTLKKGASILIPILGLHRDPKYFQSPNEYMPERFLEKGDSLKNVFMPFGGGPRMCLGSRFGVMLIKVAIIQAIRYFEVSVDPKMIQPLKFDPLSFAFFPKGGVWLRFKKI